MNTKDLKRTQKTVGSDFEDLINRLEGFNSVGDMNYNRDLMVSENIDMAKRAIYKLEVMKDNMNYLNKDDIYKFNTLILSINSILTNIAI